MCLIAYREHLVFCSSGVWHGCAVLSGWFKHWPPFQRRTNLMQAGFTASSASLLTRARCLQCSDTTVCLAKTGMAMKVFQTAADSQSCIENALQEIKSL